MLEKISKIQRNAVPSKKFFLENFLLQMYNIYAKPMISYGIVAYELAKKKQNSVLFFGYKNAS